jgi:magnesium chelatase subunit D
LDLVATLRAGRPVAERGLLTAADGGVVTVAMAERIAPGTAARLAAALDTGEVAAERDGLALRHPARIGIVALDEGASDEERPPVVLTDRLAFHVNLAQVAPREAVEPGEAVDLAAARERMSEVLVSDEALAAICMAASAFGIASLRAGILALRAAKAAAALAGRREVTPDDAALAARLVLGPRATRMPAGEAEAETPADDPGPDASEPQEGEGEDDRPEGKQSLDDLVLSAVAAAVPPGLLDALRQGSGDRARSLGPGGSGVAQRSRLRGRPAGTTRGDPKRGARLNVVETLRVAAPWQPLRREPGTTRIVIRRDDLRITRFKRRTETTTIFVVDASGSLALSRLAEAKGAVEFLLADCYVRRDRVALIAFRGASADLILPPTRSLTRAKRSLSALPGGGGTPSRPRSTRPRHWRARCPERAGARSSCSSPTDAATSPATAALAGSVRRTTPSTAARALRGAGLTTLFIDTSPRAQDPARRLAAEMGARYLPLPAADAATLSGIVRREVAAAEERSAR